MIDGKNFFDRLAKNDIKTYYNIWKIESDQGAIVPVHYTTGCFFIFISEIIIRWCYQIIRWCYRFK